MKKCKAISLILIFSLVISAAFHATAKEDDMINQHMSVAVGRNIDAILNKDGTVQIIGYEEFNWLGDCADWADIVQISMGVGELSYAYMLGVRQDGTVLTAGRAYGEGHPIHKWTEIIKVAASGQLDLGLKQSGTVVTNPESAAAPEIQAAAVIESWENITDISAGKNHFVGVKADGTVVATGDNSYGQCDVQDWTDIVSVSAGDWFTLGLKKDGTVVAVGKNDDGQCNVGDWQDITMISAGRDHSVGLKSDGTVVAIGNGNYWQRDVDEWSDITYIAAVDNGTAAIKNDEQFYNYLIHEMEKDSITVTLNGKKIIFDPVLCSLPIMENDRVLVPMRPMFEALGAVVEFDEETQTVSATKDDISISLQIGSNILYKNGEEIPLDVPAKILNRRWTMVPVRAISESFGATVDWNEGEKTVIIQRS